MRKTAAIRGFHCDIRPRMRVLFGHTVSWIDAVRHDGEIARCRMSPVHVAPIPFQGMMPAFNHQAVSQGDHSMPGEWNR